VRKRLERLGDPATEEMWYEANEAVRATALLAIQDRRRKREARGPGSGASMPLRCPGERLGHMIVLADGPGG
jgi:hypothetical protein